MRELLILLLSAALVTHPIAAEHPPCCGPITPAGHHLTQTLHSMHVESLWLANQHINWQTGEPDRGAGYEGPGNHTHCSAFAAAAADRLGIYLLRPPQHGQQLLANAQAQWIAGADGRKAGWRPISQMRQAQQLANQGEFVVVLYQNPDQHVPGHIAVLRPSEKSNQALLDNGPETIQAAQHNHDQTNVRLGFSNHPGAWPNGVRYYAHQVSSR